MNSKMNQQLTQQGAQIAVSPLVQLHHLHHATSNNCIPGMDSPCRYG